MKTETSIYDYRDNEIETVRRIRRERRAAILEAAICVPLLALAAAVWVIACAAM